MTRTVHRRPVTTAVIAMVMGSACAVDDSPATDPLEGAQTVAPLMVDDHSVYIDRPADRVWAEIRRLYVDGDRYAGYGNEIVDIGHDLTAYRGGYRAIETTADGERIDRGVFRFSDIDEAKRFVAMSVETPDPTVRNLTVIHHVTEMGAGANYTVIISANLLLGGGGVAPATVEEVASEMKERTDAHNLGLRQIMNTVKSEIEAGV